MRVEDSSDDVVTVHPEFDVQGDVPGPVTCVRSSAGPSPSGTRALSSTLTVSPSRSESSKRMCAGEVLESGTCRFAMEGAEFPPPLLPELAATPATPAPQPERSNAVARPGRECPWIWWVMVRVSSKGGVGSQRLIRERALDPRDSWRFYGGRRFVALPAGFSGGLYRMRGSVILR